MKKIQTQPPLHLQKSGQNKAQPFSYAKGTQAHHTRNQKPANGFLAEWKERYKGRPFPSVIISAEPQPQKTVTRISTPSGVVKID